MCLGTAPLACVKMIHRILIGAEGDLAFPGFVAQAGPFLGDPPIQDPGGVKDLVQIVALENPLRHHGEQRALQCRPRCQRCFLERDIHPALVRDAEARPERLRAKPLPKRLAMRLRPFPRCPAARTGDTGGDRLSVRQPFQDLISQEIVVDGTDDERLTVVVMRGSQRRQYLRRASGGPTDHVLRREGVEEHLVREADPVAALSQQSRGLQSCRRNMRFTVQIHQAIEVADGHAERNAFGEPAGHLREQPNAIARNVVQPFSREGIEQGIPAAATAKLLTRLADESCLQASCDRVEKMLQVFVQRVAARDAEGDGSLRLRRGRRHLDRVQRQ